MIDTATGVTILGMAVATYVTKASGLWLMGQFEVSGRVEAWLETIPDAIVVSIVAPIVVNGGPVEWIGGLAVVIVAWRTDNILGSIVAGIGTVWLLRTLGIA